MNHLTQKQLRARGLAKIARKLIGCKIETGDNPDGGGAVSTGEAQVDGSEQQQEQQAQGGTGQQPDSATLGTDADLKAANADPAAGSEQQQA